MNSTLNSLARFSGCLLISYLAMAFLVWEWNPGKWGQEYRVLSAVLMGGYGWWFFGVVGVFFVRSKSEQP